MPVTRLLLGRAENLQPVAASDLLGRVCSDIDHTHLVVAAEPVVVHDPDLEGDLSGVHARQVKLERLVVDRDERVFLDHRFPLEHSFIVVDDVHFHIGICGWVWSHDYTVDS